jgi:hypothetical protein
MVIVRKQELWRNNMSANLKVVSTTTDPMVEISNAIKSGTWSNIEKDVDLLQFVVKPTPDTYNINVNRSLQVRLSTLNLEFIDRQVKKVQNTGNKTGLKMPVLVYFAKEVEYEETVFPSDSFALLDRNHGVLIRVNCDIFTSDCYVINFDDDLDSKLSNIRTLGNLLNLVFEESQSTSIDNIRTEYHQLMDERVDNGLEASPSSEENALFISRYQFINSASLANFVGGHKTGGRRKPTWVPTEVDKMNAETNIKKRYSEWLVMSPRTCASWSGEASGAATWDTINKINDKVVFIFYAKTKAQEEKTYQDKIETKFKGWAERYHLEVKVIFMQPPK